VLIAAVCRGRDVLIPNGRTVIEPGDRVITLSMLSSASALESLFSL
jgi:Trk K+ transport system NAD-binding subunit